MRADHSGIVSTYDRSLGETDDFNVIGVTGPASADAKETVYFNRAVHYVGTVEGPQMDIDVDQRHVDIVLNLLSLRRAKSVTTPSVNMSGEQVMRT